LVTNTSIDALERVVKRVDVLVEEVKTLQKEFTSVENSATTSSTKTAELSASLKTKATKLESAKK
jgi:hypothetical protein